MRTTVVFVHGFTGDDATWNDFPKLLRSDPELRDYDFHFWAYPTELNPTYLVTKFFWSDDPAITTIGQSLRTYLTAHAEDADRIMLVGHSMGGLVIQTFIIEELVRQSHHFLNRLTEVVVCGTPSAGLAKAKWGSFLKNQISDMNAHGPFIEKLRAAWKLFVDDTRSAPERLARFRFTPIAGDKDKFVPEEASLRPFPLDEQFVVPGTHTEMVKPRSTNDVIYRIVRQRLTSTTRTAAEHNRIGVEEATLMSRVVAARDLGDVETLHLLSAEVETTWFAAVARELGLALLGVEQYAESVQLLRRYLDSSEHRQRPAIDVQAVQQLAIALSGKGDIVDAVAELNRLPQDDSETLGITAGRFKRQWLKSPQAVRLGWQAHDLYKKAFELARSRSDNDQVIYNGINVAYMNFVLGGQDYSVFAQEVLATCSVEQPSYWNLASKAEAELLVDKVIDAEQSYRQAQRMVPSPRDWNATGQQALDILRRKNIATSAIAQLFAGSTVA